MFRLRFRVRHLGEMDPLQVVEVRTGEVSNDYTRQIFPFCEISVNTFCF